MGLPLIWLTSYIFQTGLLPSPSILLVRLGATPLLAYPKDLFLGLFSIFCLLQILAFFSHLVLSQVILMPTTFNPTNIAQHLRTVTIRTMSQATDARNA